VGFGETLYESCGQGATLCLPTGRGPHLQDHPGLVAYTEKAYTTLGVPFCNVQCRPKFMVSLLPLTLKGGGGGVIMDPPTLKPLYSEKLPH